MNVHITYKLHKTPDIEKEINHLTEKVGKRVQVFRPDLVHLHGSLEENSAREGTVVSLNLRLPTGQLAARRSAPTGTAAVKAALDDLLQQLTKHKDLLRTTHDWPRRRSGKERITRQVPFEETLAAVQTPKVRSEDVRSYVNANLNRLERFVERELYFREISGEIDPDSVSREEVVDEAIMRALSDGGEKPERLALEPWLYHLAIRSLNEIAAPAKGDGREVHLEESARQRNVGASDEAELQFHQSDETSIEETLIADTRLATPEDIASSDEMVQLVQFALGAVSRHDREAFLLHGLEGFSVEEVSAITGRSAEQVQNSIAATRAHLRKSAFISEGPRARLIRHAGTA
jgi:RNA polymerase sigma factor (sigma-70 family)